MHSRELISIENKYVLFLKRGSSHPWFTKLCRIKNRSKANLVLELSIEILVHSDKFKDNNTKSMKKSLNK
jgi:hypothetical protein